MTFDSLILAAIVEELRARVLGKRVSEVFQPDARTVVLSLRLGGRAEHLLLSASPDAYRVHLVSTPPPPPEMPLPFARQLTSRLRGARLTAAEQVEFDRLLRLSLHGTDRLGNPRRFTLLGEFMGKHSNLLLLDEQEVIVAVIKPVSHRVNRVRELLPGRKYLPPPSGHRCNPLTLSPEAFCDLWAQRDSAVPLKTWARQTFFGLSDDLWRWLCAQANLPEDAPGDSPQEAGERLWAAWAELQTLVATGQFTPILYCEARGEPVKCYPLPLPPPAEGEGGSPQRAEPVASLSRALELVFATAQRRAERLHWQQRVRQALNSALRRAQRRRERAAAQLAAAADPEQFKIRGDLILAHYHQVQPGQEFIEVPNYYDPNLTPLRIELDPRLTPAANAERYYRQAAKARRAREQLPARIAALEEEISRLTAWREQAETASTTEELQQLWAEMAPILGGPAATKPRARRPPTRREEWLQKLERHLSRDGYEIVVGKNAIQNEALLSYVAAPDDIWLHVRGAGSGHVIIRTQGRPHNVPPTTLEEAARLAAQHSPARHSALVPVSYTLRKYVTKVKGGSPGQVTYRHEKTLFVSPSGEV
ncbi:MAG TPA: fibronectin-binding domain-containing protein [Armatimonadetes bacterium]|nr:fibronectin-binding domain-containing protein [Armatimonadota bacterium]